MFSQRTRYVLKILFYLIDMKNSDYMTVEELSEIIDIPEPYLGKIVGFLAKSGYLTTKKGPHGGAQISERTPSTPIKELLTDLGELPDHSSQEPAGSVEDNLEQSFLEFCVEGFKDQVLNDLTLEDFVRQRIQTTRKKKTDPV